MVALNTAYAPSKTRTQPKNRVGDFFYEVGECVGSNRLASRIATKEKSGYGYESASGRPVWPSRDPIGERGGLNLYAMVGNNPISFVDPLGLEKCRIDLFFGHIGDALNKEATDAANLAQAHKNWQEKLKRGTLGLDGKLPSDPNCGQAFGYGSCYPTLSG